MGNKRKPAQGLAAHSKKKKFSKGPKGPQQSSNQQNVQLPPDSDEEGQNEYEVQDEDVEFVQQYGSQLGFLTSLSAEELNKAVKDKQKPAAAAAAAAAAAQAGSRSDEEPVEVNSEDGAEEYERQPRAAEQVQKATSKGLPVKTATGELVYHPNRQQQQQQLQSAKIQVAGVTVQDTRLLEQQMRKSENAAAAAAAEEAQREAAKLHQQQQQQHRKSVTVDQGTSLPPALLSLMSIADQSARREALKQQMALAAQHLLAEPDKHVGPGLRLLLGCATDRDGHVVRLALLSCVAVFRDLLPGYRIRSVAQDKQEMRVSKDVAALRDFEQSLLKGYQAFLKILVAAATAKPSSGSSSSSVLATARVAVRCMGQLLVSRPGFNYSSDLLQALVPLMVHPDTEIHHTTCDTIKQLLLMDIQGTTSLEAVQLVADLVKKRKCNLPPLVVSSLLVARFEQVTPTSQGGDGIGSKGPKKAGGKKARKRKNSKSDVDRDFDEAAAAPDAAQLAILQSQLLEALFEIFFRVLKHCSTATSNNTAAAAPQAIDTPTPTPTANGIHNNNSSSSGEVLVQPWSAVRVHKRFPLLQPTLEGLGRYSHLISVEYFNDLMNVLQELLSTGALPLRERLGVLLAALDILKGQGEALTIDRRAFYNHLYQTLLLVPLHVIVESTAATAAAADDDTAAAAAAETDREDLQALEAVSVSLLGWEAAATSSSSSGGGGGKEVVPTSVLLLRCLEQQLLGTKQTDVGRLAAFTKRLAEIVLSSSTAEAVGATCLMWRLIKRYNKLLCQFEWEGGAPVGGRQYDPDCADPSEAGGMAAALWELPLMTQHYHPDVAAAARALLALTPSNKTAAAAAGRDAASAGGSVTGAVTNVRSVITGAAAPHELAGEYEAIKRGGFRPAPVAPGVGFRGGGSAAAAVGSSKAGMAARQAAATAVWCPDLQQAVSAAAAAASTSGLSGVTLHHCHPQHQHKQQQGKRQKQQQQQQKQLLRQQESVQVQDVMPADDFDEQQVISALQQQYQLSKWHHRNQQLRHELAVTARKVELFREHLIQKHQQQQQQRQSAKKQRQKHKS